MERDLATLGELAGVGEEIGDDLLDAMWVASD